MKTLRLGSAGIDVEKWQIFLRGRKKNSCVVVLGNFDQITHDETREFQLKYKLKDDGVVGPTTMSTALKLGYNTMSDSSVDEYGPNWPARPSVKSLTFQDRVKVFGNFSYIPSPTPSNPEAITITDNWAKNNIAAVEVKQLRSVKGSPTSCRIQIHESIEKQIVQLFNTWEEACLSEQLKSWGGSWVPRFIRGSRTSLSNHAWGTAFDINVKWNMLGTVPALKGKEGSVRELVEIAFDHGFYWGGWYPHRPDGMHFEAYKIL